MAWTWWHRSRCGTSLMVSGITTRLRCTTPKKKPRIPMGVLTSKLVQVSPLSLGFPALYAAHWRKSIPRRFPGWLTQIPAAMKAAMPSPTLMPTHPTMALPRKFGSLFQPGTVERWLGCKSSPAWMRWRSWPCPLKPLLWSAPRFGHRLARPRPAPALADVFAALNWPQLAGAGGGHFSFCWFFCWFFLKKQRFYIGGFESDNPLKFF